MDELSRLCRADAAIVVGGLAGYLLGAALSDAGVRVVVIDHEEDASTALPEPATLLCAPVFAQIQAVHGLDAARTHALCLQDQLRALTASPVPYVQQLPTYAFARKGAEVPQLMHQYELLTALSLPVCIAPDAGGCPFPVERSMLLSGQAAADVPRWMASLRASIRRRGGIFFPGPVIAVEAGRIRTAKGWVEAGQIILATGTPTGLRNRRILSLLETRMLVRCSLTEAGPLHSIQQSLCGDFRLYPSASGPIAAWDAGRMGTRRQEARLKEFQRVLSTRTPDWRPGEMQYSQAAFPADGLPFIGALPGQRLLCACGLGGSILCAMHAAEVLTRRILGLARPEDGLYAPERKLPPAFLRKAAVSDRSLYARNLLRRNAPPCPHCGCRMRYCTPAQRWECPWCGSAYTMFGRPLCGPTLRCAQVSARQRPLG